MDARGDELVMQQVIGEAIRAVAVGGSVIDPRIVESMLTARSRPDRSRLRELTTREREVLAEMATEGCRYGAEITAAGTGDGWKLYDVNRCSPS